MKAEDYIKLENDRDELITKAANIVTPKIGKGSTWIESASIGELGVSLKIGFSCMGSCDYEYETVSWEELGV